MAVVVVFINNKQLAKQSLNLINVVTS